MTYKDDSPTRLLRLARVGAATIVALSMTTGALPGAGAPSAHAAVPPGETLQDYAARGGVQDSRDNLTMPSPGVSRVHLDQGQMNGYKVRGAIPSATEATLSYQVKVPRDTHDNGLALVDLKIPGMAGSPTHQSPWYASSGGDLQPDSFSVRLHARKSSSSSVGRPWLDAYIYAPYAAGRTFSTWGIPVPLSTGLNGSGERLPIPVDRWFDVKIRVKVNTPGVNNGELDIWIDGQQGVALRDVRWRPTGVTTPINLLMAETFYNSPGAPKNAHIDFANFSVTIAGSPSPSGVTSTSTDVAAYVTSVYSDLFGRSPDPSGLATWTRALQSGTPYRAVADGITCSREFRTRLITGAYRAYLGRAPEAAGIDHWLREMEAGMQIQALEAGFVASEEYYRRSGGTDGAWVGALYADVLGRSASRAEAAGWVQAVQSQGRLSVARSFLYSTEELTTVVDGYYRWLLRRSIDPTGRRTWVEAIQAGARNEQIIGAVISSAEYRSRVAAGS